MSKCLGSDCTAQLCAPCLAKLCDSVKCGRCEDYHGVTAFMCEQCRRKPGGSDVLKYCYQCMNLLCPEHTCEQNCCVCSSNTHCAPCGAKRCGRCGNDVCYRCDLKSGCMCSRMSGMQRLSMQGLY